jgi:hypothetical protein
MIPTATYDGVALRFGNVKDEIVFKNNILKLVSAYVNCRSYWLLKHNASGQMRISIDLLSHFIKHYQHHGLLAVAKRVDALQTQLRLLLPNPNGGQKAWCEKINNLIIICHAIAQDEDYYIHRQRQRQAAGHCQLPEGRIASPAPNC